MNQVIDLPSPDSNSENKLLSSSSLVSNSGDNEVQTQMSSSTLPVKPAKNPKRLPTSIEPGIISSVESTVVSLEYATNPPNILPSMRWPSESWLDGVENMRENTGNGNKILDYIVLAEFDIDTGSTVRHLVINCDGIIHTLCRLYLLL